MKRKIQFIILLIAALCGAHAQQTDTVYFNADWKKTTKDSARYYREIKKEFRLYYVKDHYLFGGIQMTGAFSMFNPDKHEGNFVYYDSSGRKTLEEYYINNKHEGERISYFEDGTPWIKENYKDDKLDGEQLYFYKSGQVKRREKYKEGELKKGYCYTPSGKDTTYYPFEQMPEFKGGALAMMKYIQANIKYPDEAKENGIEGRVFIKFVVSASGKIENVEVLKGVDPLLNMEALRVVKSMPDWEPGRQDGKPVKVYFTLPLSFRLGKKK